MGQHGSYACSAAQYMTEFGVTMVTLHVLCNFLLGTTSNPSDVTRHTQHMMEQA